MRNRPRLAAWLLAGLLAIAQGDAARADWNTQLYGAHAEAALLDSANVSESSGVVASRANPGIYWTHNDSGGTPNVWIFRLNAADLAAHTAHALGSVYLPSASNVDWEDIAAGPGPSIYVFDGGDNPVCDRTNKRIHRFVEPPIDPNGAPVTLTPAFDSLRFEYPDTTSPSSPADTNDERYDCETLLVHPVTGDIYLVTKRTSSNTASARVYKLPAASITWNSAAVHVLQFVVDISATVTGTPTGGEIDPFGRRVLIRNYGTAYEFVLPTGQLFDTIFVQTPRTFSLAGELQGEGICYAADGGNILATSEVLGIGPQTCPVYLIPWQLANLRVGAIAPDHATLQWDTAAAAGSTVDYGTTTAYGSTLANPTLVTAHEVSIASLLPGTRYYYRATSGALVYPAPAQAGQVYFTTLAGQPGDFDLDSDVDQADFGTLQACLSGPNVPQNEAACQAARLDADNDVDDADLAAFRACMSGPAHPANPACAG